AALSWWGCGLQWRRARGSGVTWPRPLEHDAQPHQGDQHQLGVPGVIGGKFTVSYNWLFIKWLQWPINRYDTTGFAVQYGYIPISACSHLQHNVLFFQM